jgi:hypothetical protein
MKAEGMEDEKGLLQSLANQFVALILDNEVTVGQVRCRTRD